MGNAVPVLLLARSVENIEQSHLVVDDTLLAVTVLNGRVVFVDEVALDKLNGQRTLAHT